MADAVQPGDLANELDKCIADGEELATSILTNISTFPRDSLDIAVIAKALSFPTGHDPRGRYNTWTEYCVAVLRHRLTPPEAANGTIMEFLRQGNASAIAAANATIARYQAIQAVVKERVRWLRSFRSQLHLLQMVSPASSATSPALETRGTSGTAPPPEQSRVFIVHGHNETVLSEVEMFLRRGGVTPIILHREANAGRTIIEKFEAHVANVGFALVLLTADDRGGPRPPRVGKKVLKWKFDPQPRARQNVVFELGFFFAALGRKNVCALYEHGVELPSDLHGVVYVELKGDWKGQVARELDHAGIPFNTLKALA